jgi:hypothetical protein
MVLAMGATPCAALTQKAIPAARDARRPAKLMTAPKPAAMSAKSHAKIGTAAPKSNASPAPAESKTIYLHRSESTDPMQSGPFCRLLGRNAADDAIAMLEVSAVTQSSPSGDSLTLTGFQIEITDYGQAGELPTVARCLITAADAAGMSNSLGSILAHAADWKDRDLGYRGAAYQTPGGFGLQFSQDQSRRQRTVAVCGQGAGRYVFTDIGQVILLKERLDKELQRLAESR